MAEQPLTPEMAHRAATTRLREEAFRPMRVGVDGLVKALAGDDADALSADETKPIHPPITCLTCGFIGPPRAVERHIHRRGHTDRPEPERTPNEQVAANPDGDTVRQESLRKALASPDTAPLDRLGATYELAMLEGGRRVNGKRRCTVCGAVVDDSEASLRKHSRATSHGSFAPYFK